MIPGLNTQTISPFPNPPEFSQLFTNERISQGSALPPPAPHTEFRVFGEDYRLDDEVIPPLSASGIRVLYTNKNDWKAEMKKLNRSACVAFMDLIEILIRCPDHPSRDEKMNDIHTIFINMHHLINEYRPVQARDTIRLLQKQQVEQLADTVERFKSYLADGQEVLAEQFAKAATVKLSPPPKPKPETNIQFLDDENEEEKIEEDVVKMEMETEEEPKRDKKMRRLETRPSEIRLRERMAQELEDVKLIDVKDLKLSD